MHNSRGDILGFYNSSGDVYVAYTYDAWGLVTSVKNSSGQNVISPDLLANIQPLRYRGYAYDNETGLYYLQSRYYDPLTRRFINADGLVSTDTGVLGYNMFAYCNNNSTSLVDDGGNRPTSGTSLKDESADDRHDAGAHMAKSISLSQSLPIKGEPNSSKELQNPDGSIKQKRWYGPSEEAIRDRDYNHTGDMEFPHDHEWKDGVRGKEHLKPSPEFQISWENILGAGITIGSSLLIVLIVADDITGIGAIDDFLLAPLAVAIGEGIAITSY